MEVLGFSKARGHHAAVATLTAPVGEEVRVVNAPDGHELATVGAASGFALVLAASPRARFMTDPGRS
jgi:hypothetical protein